LTRYRKGSGRSRIDQHALHRIRFHDAPTANITFTKRISERGRPPVVGTMSHRIRGTMSHRIREQERVLKITNARLEEREN